MSIQNIFSRHERPSLTRNSKDGYAASPYVSVVATSIQKIHKVKSIFIVLSLMLVSSLAYSEPIEFEYGIGPFLAKTVETSRVTFSETPTFLAVSGHPGGDGKSTYYEIMTINNITFSIVNANSNKPGMRRLSDVGHQGTYDFYRDARSGNFLIPGLGNALNNDDGIRLDFSALEPPITAFGAHWGSVQEGSPCCIVQLFRFFLESGATEDVIFDSSNAYQGNGVSSNAGTFFGFRSTESPISGVIIEQLGHNPALDNVIVGEAALPPQPTPKRIIINARDFGVPGVDPLDAITFQVEGSTAAQKSIREMKPNWQENVEQNSDGADIAERVSSLPIHALLKYYAGQLASGLRINSLIFQKYSNDPPRYDYHIVAQFSGAEVVTNFEEQFGPAFSILDDTFLNWGYAAEALDLGLVTLERLQGAYLDNEQSFFSLQASTFQLFAAESDNLFAIIGDRVDQSRLILEAQGIEDFCIESDDIMFFDFLKELARKLHRLPMEFSLDPDNEIFSDGFESGDLSLWSNRGCIKTVDGAQSPRAIPHGRKLLHQEPRNS